MTDEDIERLNKVYDPRDPFREDPNGGDGEDD
jgi:hypothetical protein